MHSPSPVLPETKALTRRDAFSAQPGCMAAEAGVRAAMQEQDTQIGPSRGPGKVIAAYQMLVAQANQEPGDSPADCPGCSKRAGSSDGFGLLRRRHSGIRLPPTCRENQQEPRPRTKS
jgi:hypothetical protein